METMPEPIRTKEEEEFAWGMLIKALSGGLYPNKYDIIREYVQNSYDAIAEWAKNHDARECSIKVQVGGSSIFIFDTGTGMTHEKVGEYRYLGFSKKSYQEFVGYRGIGKAAGIAVAEELIVTTSPYGVAERYILTIRAGDMLRRVEEERKRGENSTINELMSEYTEVTTESEDRNRHYTHLELRGIRSDAQELLDQSRLMIYLSTVTPVPFHPDFKSDTKNFGVEIDEKLRENVPGYFPANIFVGGEQVYKLYRTQWTRDNSKVGVKQDNKKPENVDNIVVKEPEYVEITDSGGNLIAYCWYCANATKGQIDMPFIYNGQPVDLGGLVYKLRGFTIGDKQTVRNTAWQSSPHLAYYYIGEIHVCDENIEPTAERSGFIDNPARTLLFNACWKALGKQLYRKAHAQSEKLRAAEVINGALDDLDILEQEIEKGIDKTEVFPKQVRLHEIFKAVDEKKKKEIDDKTKQKADNIIERSQKLFSMLSEESPKEEDKAMRSHAIRITDITQELSFDKETARVYDVIIHALRDFFAGDIDNYERVIVTILDRLRREFGS